MLSPELIRWRTVFVRFWDIEGADTQGDDATRRFGFVDDRPSARPDSEIESENEVFPKMYAARCHLRKYPPT